jgi:arabinofuranosyltransferase
MNPSSDDVAQGGAEPSPGRLPAGLALLLGAVAAWGGWFVFRSSLLVGGRRVFCLFDDAMISMTYARNLVEGHGLNWARRGAPVEGFTHPLWTAMMVPVQLLPLPLDRRALVVQAVALAVLLLHVVVVRRLVLRHFSLPLARHWAPAAVATAFYFPLAFWTLIGMETGLQSLLTTISVLLALDIVHRRRDRRWALALTGAAAVLLRLDMLLWVLAVQGYVAVFGRRTDPPRPPAPRLSTSPETVRPPAAALPPVLGAWRLGVTLPLAALAAYGVFRWVYFGALLPNTYYLKLGGVPLAVRLLRGGSTLLDTLRAYGPLLLVVAVGVVPPLAALRRSAAARAGAAQRRWGERLALPALLFVLACAYSVYVGGDAWEGEVSANRFVAFAMPLVFVLANGLLNRALAACVALARAARRRRRRPQGGGGAAAAGQSLPVRYAVVVATVALLFAADGLGSRATAAEAWRRLAVITPPLHAANYEQLLTQLRQLQTYADPTAAVAVTWAGTTAYFSDFQMIDQLGYNDSYIAHRPPALALSEDNFGDFVPGHVKWDIAYVLDRQRPDALLGIWGDEPTRQALLAHGYLRLDGTWVNPDSPRLHLSPDDVGRLDDGDDDDTSGDDGAGSGSGSD